MWSNAVGPVGKLIGWTGWGRVKLALFLAVVALAGASYIGWTKAAADRDTAQEALKSAQAEVKQLELIRTVDNQTLKDRNDRVQVVIQREIKSQEVLSDALKANPDWANQPVPDDVISSLQ